jgi:hypothetical protein
VSRSCADATVAIATSIAIVMSFLMAPLDNTDLEDLDA